MKTVCIYHSIDLDGWMSAAIVKHWFEQSLVITNPNIDSIIDKIDFIGYNYGQPIPDLSEYDKVIMCDISFPKDTMSYYWDKLDNNFIWIDHHISAILPFEEEFKHRALALFRPNYMEGLLNTKFAACELTWKYFFPNEKMPELVRLLGRYDCFGHKGTDEETKVLEFQYGARQVITTYEEAYVYLTQSLITPTLLIDDIHIKGKSIYSYLCTEAKQVYKNGFELIFNNLYSDRTKFICINRERFNPINFGIDYHKDGYDGAACFHYDGVDKVWRFSLYNDNGLVDCSQIAKQYGGGGHKGAAGFVINDINEFFNL